MRNVGMRWNQRNQLYRMIMIIIFDLILKLL